MISDTNKKFFVEVFLHVLFWIIIFRRFYCRSFLRLWCTPTIEITCFLLLFGIVYVNIFLMVPQLWAKNKKTLYCFSFILLVLISAGVEELLCLNTFKDKVLSYSNLSVYHKYVYDTYISISLRNGSFLMFSTFYKLFKMSRETVKKSEEYISRHTDKIVLFTDGESKEIEVNEIAYIEVRKRNICLFTDRYNCLQDRTFSEFENLLPPNSYLRINRQIVIMYSHLNGYSNQKVFLHQGEDKISFSYSTAPSFNVLQQLKEWDASLYQKEEGTE